MFGPSVVLPRVLPFTQFYPITQGKTVQRFYPPTLPGLHSFYVSPAPSFISEQVVGFILALSAADLRIQKLKKLLKFATAKVVINMKVVPFLGPSVYSQLKCSIVVPRITPEDICNASAKPTACQSHAGPKIHHLLWITLNCPFLYIHIYFTAVRAAF